MHIPDFPITRPFINSFEQEILSFFKSRWNKLWIPTQILPGFQEVWVWAGHDDGTFRRCDERVDGAVKSFVDVVENDVDVFKQNDGCFVQLSRSGGGKEGAAVPQNLNPWFWFILRFAISADNGVFLVTFSDVVTLRRFAQVWQNLKNNSMFTEFQLFLLFKLKEIATIFEFTDSEVTVPFPDQEVKEF